MSWVWKWIGTPTSSRRRLDQPLGGERLAQAGHVLDGDQVGAALLQLLGQIDVIRQVVLGPARVEDVAGVADRRLAERSRLADGLERQLHVGHPVERVEDAEQVDPGGGRLLDERLDDVVGIARVADGVRAAQQHLEEDVGDLLAELGQPFPGVFLEEPHGRVEGRAAPHLDREDARAEPGVGIGHAEHVAGPDPGGQERLVGVAERGVGQEQRLLLANPARESLGAHRLEPLARAVGRRPEASNAGARGSAGGACPGGRADAGKAVDGDLGGVGQELRRPVLADRELEKLGVLVDEPGRALAGQEIRVRRPR